MIFTSTLRFSTRVHQNCFEMNLIFTSTIFHLNRCSQDQHPFKSLSDLHHHSRCDWLSFWSCWCHFHLNNISSQHLLSESESIQIVIRSISPFEMLLIIILILMSSSPQQHFILISSLRIRIHSNRYQIYITIRDVTYYYFDVDVIITSTTFHLNIFPQNENPFNSFSDLYHHSRCLFWHGSQSSSLWL